MSTKDSEGKTMRTAGSEKPGKAGRINVAVRIGEGDFPFGEPVPPMPPQRTEKDSALRPDKAHMSSYVPDTEGRRSQGNLPEKPSENPVKKQAPPRMNVAVRLPDGDISTGMDPQDRKSASGPQRPDRQHPDRFGEKKPGSGSGRTSMSFPYPGQTGRVAKSGQSSGNRSQEFGAGTSFGSGMSTGSGMSSGMGRYSGTGRKPYPGPGSSGRSSTSTSERFSGYRDKDKDRDRDRNAGIPLRSGMPVGSGLSPGQGPGSRGPGQNRMHERFSGNSNPGTGMPPGMGRQPGAGRPAGAGRPPGADRPAGAGRPPDAAMQRGSGMPPGAGRRPNQGTGMPPELVMQRGSGIPPGAGPGLNQGTGMAPGTGNRQNPGLAGRNGGDIRFPGNAGGSSGSNGYGRQDNLFLRNQMLGNRADTQYNPYSSGINFSGNNRPGGTFSDKSRPPGVNNMAENRGRSTGSRQRKPEDQPYRYNGTTGRDQAPEQKRTTGFGQDDSRQSVRSRTGRNVPGNRKRTGPAYARRRERRKTLTIASIILGVFFCVSIGLVYASREVYVVRKVKIIGNLSCTAEEVFDQSGILKGQPIYSVTASYVKKAFDKHKEISLNSLTLEMPDTVVLDVSQNESMAYVSEMGVCYAIDENAVVHNRLQVKDALDSNFPTILNLENPVLRIGKVIESDNPRQIDAITKILSFMKYRYVYTKVNEIDVANIRNIKLITDKRLVVNLGDAENLENKFAVMDSVVFELQKKNVDSGSLNVSNGFNAVYKGQEDG